MKQERLLSLVRDKVRRMLNHYIQSGEVTDSIQAYIVAPKRGENAGVLGAFELAKLELGIPH